MDEIVIYEKTTCSKCRLAIQILDTEGVPYRAVRYHDAPLTETKLRDLIRKLGIAPSELLRRHDPLFRSLGLHEKNITDDEAVALMLAHPDLMERPILERGDVAIVGRPTERVTEFLHAR